MCYLLSMPSYRVEFYQRRTLVIHLTADSEDDIHEFLEDNPDWNVLEDAPEAIDEDSTEDELPEEEIDYAVYPAPSVTPSYGIHEGVFVEVEE